MHLFRTTGLLIAALLIATPALAAPGKSALRGPLAKTGKRPVFVFAEVSGSTWYYLWVSNPSGAILKKWYRTSESNCSAGECSIDPALDLPAGLYSWWIQTYDSSGNGPWSDKGGFEVDPNGGSGGTSGAGIDLPPAVPFETVHWIDHLGFRAGSDGIEISFDALDSGIGLGTSGLVVTAGPGASAQVIEQGLAIPPGLLVEAVRVCFESTSPAASLAEVRIEQLQDPPDATQALLVDAAGFAAAGATCVDTSDAATPIVPSDGGLRLQLGFVLPAPGAGLPATEGVVIRSVGLHVVSDPDGPIQQELERLRAAIVDHTHEYLTGRGNGHNNTKAITSEPLSGN